MTAHKHHQHMLDYAKDAAETDKPWERWEVRVVGTGWFDAQDEICFTEKCEYRRKPQKKVVDLSVLIKSGIDCEFSGAEENIFGKLVNVQQTDDGVKYVRECGHYQAFDHCRPRMNHWHHWNGGECPLPEGFNVEVMDRIGVTHIGDASYFNWKHSKDMLDIIAFKVTGLQEGWEWPWSVEE